MYDFDERRVDFGDESDWVFEDCEEVEWIRLLKLGGGFGNLMELSDCDSWVYKYYIIVFIIIINKLINTPYFKICYILL